jgi:hypothetical protein
MMGAAGRARVESHFTRHRMVNETARILARHVDGS